MAITKKIIITGGAGFIGLNLARQLAQENYNVIIWDNLSRGKYDIYLKNLLRKKNVKFIKKDLTKKINTKKMNISHIFHLGLLELDKFQRFYLNLKYYQLDYIFFQ